MRFRWTFDDAAQTLRAPSGLSLTVRDIATWVQDRVYHRHDLTGPWAGWRVRGRWLVGPKGLRVTPQMVRQLATSADADPEKRVWREGIVPETDQQGSAAGLGVIDL